MLYPDNKCFVNIEFQYFKSFRILLFYAITVTKESFEKCAAGLCCNAAECSGMANHIVDRFNKLTVEKDFSTTEKWKPFLNISKSDKL